MRPPFRDSHWLEVRTTIIFLRLGARPITGHNTYKISTTLVVDVGAVFYSRRRLVGGRCRSHPEQTFCYKVTMSVASLQRAATASLISVTDSCFSNRSHRNPLPQESFDCPQTVPEVEPLNVYLPPYRRSVILPPSATRAASHRHLVSGPGQRNSPPSHPSRQNIRKLGSVQPLRHRLSGSWPDACHRIPVSSNAAASLSSKPVLKPSSQEGKLVSCSRCCPPAGGSKMDIHTPVQ